LLIKTKLVSNHTADSKPVKQEVNGTVILPPLVFPRLVVTRRSIVLIFPFHKGFPVPNCFLRLFQVGEFYSVNNTIEYQSHVQVEWPGRSVIKLFFLQHSSLFFNKNITFYNIEAVVNFTQGQSKKFFLLDYRS
jgi:hypothetical protein